MFAPTYQEFANGNRGEPASPLTCSTHAFSASTVASTLTNRCSRTYAKSANQQLETWVNGATEAGSFLRLSTLFLHSPTPQISLRSWQNQIGVFNPLRSQGLGFTIVRGFSVCT